MQRARRVRPGAAALTLPIAAAGGLAFYAMGAPASFLTGSAFAITVAALLRMPIAIPNRVREAGFAILGMMIGTAVTPEALSDLGRLPVALVGLCAVIAGATLVSFVILRRVADYDARDAFLGSVPGHFSMVMALSVEHGARLERVIVPQILRLIILIVLVPILLGGPDSATLRTGEAVPGGVGAVLVTVVIAVAAAMAGKAARMPAGVLLAPMIVSAVLSGTGALTVVVPSWMGGAAFIVLGASIGGRVAGVKGAGLKRMLVAAFASFVAASAVAVAGSLAVAAVLDVSIGAMFLGYAPGGLDAMIALSYLLGYDVALVALMHSARMIILGVSIPLMLTVVERRGLGRTGSSE